MRRGNIFLRSWLCLFQEASPYWEYNYIHGHTVTSSPFLLACRHCLHLPIWNLQFHHWTYYVKWYNVWELYLKVSKALFLHLSRQLFRMKSYDSWRNCIYWTVFIELLLAWWLACQYWISKQILCGYLVVISWPLRSVVVCWRTYLCPSVQVKKFDITIVS